MVPAVTDAPRRFPRGSAGALMPATGRLFFTNITNGHPFGCRMRYLASWELIGRTESDISAICTIEQHPLVVTANEGCLGVGVSGRCSTGLRAHCENS